MKKLQTAWQIVNGLYCLFVENKKFLLLLVILKNNQMSLHTAKFVANPVQQAKANQ